MILEGATAAKGSMEAIITQLNAGITSDTLFGTVG